MKSSVLFFGALLGLVMATAAFLMHDPVPELVQVGPYTYMDTNGCEWSKTGDITARIVGDDLKQICHPKGQP